MRHPNLADLQFRSARLDVPFLLNEQQSRLIDNRGGECCYPSSQPAAITIERFQARQRKLDCFAAVKPRQTRRLSSCGEPIATLRAVRTRQVGNLSAWDG